MALLVSMALPGSRGAGSCMATLCSWRRSGKAAKQWMGNTQLWMVVACYGFESLRIFETRHGWSGWHIGWLSDLSVSFRVEKKLVNPTVKLVQLPVSLSLPQSGSECPCSGLVRFGEGDRWVGKLSLKLLKMASAVKKPRHASQLQWHKCSCTSIRSGYSNMR